MKSPKVSIVAITYNHEAYIEQALENFINQKTTFDFEIIIADDCSTDNTARIIKKYQQLYPNIFRSILRKKNIGAQNNCIDALKAAKGEYIALCEGDDYWTDILKLQKQVDFLDRNLDFALCFHPVKVFYEQNEEKESIYPEEKVLKQLSLQRLMKKNLIQTNAVMYRRQTYDNIPNNILPLDWYLHLYHAQFGKIGFINDIMSAYRRHQGGLWWDSRKNIDAIWKKYGIQHLALYVEINKLYGSKAEYKNIIDQSINNLIGAFVQYDIKHNDNLIEAVLVNFSSDLRSFIYQQDIRLTNLSTQVDTDNKKISLLEEQNTHMTQVIKDREHRVELKSKEVETYVNELNDIKQSKSYRYARKMAKIKNKATDKLPRKK